MRTTDPERGAKAVRAALAVLDGGGRTLGRRTGITEHNLLGAARWTLGLLEETHRGDGLEVRVPRVGTVHILDGSTDDPAPSVVHMEPEVWVLLASGRIDWATAHSRGLVSASGPRADLSGVLPLVDVSEPQEPGSE